MKNLWKMFALVLAATFAVNSYASDDVADDGVSTEVCEPAGEAVVDDGSAEATDEVAVSDVVAEADDEVAVADDEDDTKNDDDSEEETEE